MEIPNSAFHLNQKVLLRIPDKTETGSNQIKKFNNRVHTIDQIHVIKKKHDILIGLKGVKSKAGLPFWFLKDWVIPIETMAEEE